MFLLLHPGSITNIGGQIPHPDGNVRVHYALNGTKWKINITLPQNTPGRLMWKNKEYPLKPGENSLSL